MTTVRRKTSFNPVQTFREHLVLKDDASKIGKRADALKTRLKDWLPKTDAAYRNENGSYFVDLPETITAGGVDYKGMELRRAVSTKFNEETATAVLQKKGVYEEALSTYVDQEKIYRLVQEGKITEDELDTMFEEDERFSFYPVKGEVL